MHEGCLLFYQVICFLTLKEYFAQNETISKIHHQGNYPEKCYNNSKEHMQNLKVEYCKKGHICLLYLYRSLLVVNI